VVSRAFFIEGTHTPTKRTNITRMHARVCGFFARAFRFLSRAFRFLSRAFRLLARAFRLLARAFRLLARAGTWILTRGGDSATYHFLRERFFDFFAESPPRGFLARGVMMILSLQISNSICA
jgi:hypothetical protein